MRRSSLPFVPRPETLRVIPPEPDELWDAIVLQRRNAELLRSIKAAGQIRAIGQLQELRRNQQRLATLLERLDLEGNTLDALILDTPAVVLAAKLAPLHVAEPADAMALSSPSDLVVSVQGRGFPFMAEFWVRGEYTTEAGAARAFPMQLTSQTSDLSALEFSAGCPLSSFRAAVGSTVVLVMVFELRSGRFVTRAFERFTVV